MPHPYERMAIKKRSYQLQNQVVTSLYFINESKVI